MELRMKRIFKFFCVIICTIAALFSISCVDGLAPIKLVDAKRCVDCELKMWTGYNPAATYSITPTGFDYEELDKRGYRMRIKVSYDVYYKKDYNVPYDIGYAGSPKYEVTLLTASGLGTGEQNLTTTTDSKSRSHSFAIQINDIKNTTLTLTFSTDNIQNIVYVKNIKIDYVCIK